MRFFREIKAYWRFAVYAAKCDLRAEVADSYLNWIWWLLEPISAMIIYTMIFGVVFHTEEPYFPLFVFIGITFWDFFSRCILTSINLIRENQHIISKVYIPKYILLVQRMLVLAFKMLINLGIIVVMLIIYAVPIGFNVFFLLPTIFVFYAFCFACGIILLHLGVYASDLSNALDIVLNLMFYMTGIFFNVQNSFPAPIGYIMQRMNPIAYIIFCARKSILYNEPPSLIMLSVWLTISIVLMIMGLNIIYKNENDYVKMI